MSDRKLYEIITSLILENIESGAIDRDEVRQIIVGLSRDGQSINIWQSESWEDYGEPEEDLAIARIPNLEWLGMVDSLGFTNEPFSECTDEDHGFLPDMGVSFADETLQKKFRSLLKAKIIEIRDALKLIAKEQLLGEFTKLAGLMGMRVSNSGYADLVAIYHSDGADVLPAKERRLPGYSSIYGFISLVSDGIIHFYTEGDADDEADETDIAEPAQLRHYRFGDMEYFTHDKDGVTFKLTKSGQEIEIENGHTHDEWGGPERKEICAKMIGHFSEKARHLMYDVSSIPSPDDASNWNDWLELFGKSGRKYSEAVIERLLESGGTAYADAFIRSQDYSKDETADFHKIYLQYYLNENRYEEVVSLFATIDSKKMSSTGWSCYYRSLIMLEHYAEVYETAKKMLDTTNPDTYEFTVHASFFIIAGYNLETGDDFNALLSKVERTREDILSAAKALIASSAMEMRTEISMLSRDKRYSAIFGESDFKTRPDILECVRSVFAVRDRAVILDDRLKEFISLSHTDCKIEKIEFNRAFIDAWGEGEVNRRLHIKKSVERDKGLPRAIFTSERGAWFRTENGFSMAKAVRGEAVFVSVCADESACRALYADNKYIFRASDKSLGIYSYEDDETPVLLSETCYAGIRDAEAIIVSGEIAVISGGKCLEVFDVSDTGKPASISFISLTDSFDEYHPCNALHLTGTVLYAMIDDAGCVRIDINDPLMPSITGFAPLNMSATGIETDGDTIFIYGKNRLAAIDFSHPGKPTVTAYVQFSSSAECVYSRKENGCPVFYGGISSFIFEFRYDKQVGKFQQEILPLFKEDGEVEQVYSLSAILSDGMGFILILDRNHFYALTETMPEPGVPSGEKRKQAELDFELWLESKFSEFSENRPGEAIGHVDCSWYGGGNFMLRLDGQRSLPGLHYGPVMYIDDNFQKAEMIQGELKTAMGFGEVPEERGQIEYWRAEVVRRSAETVFKGVIPRITRSEKFKAAAPARVYITSTCDKPVVCACIDNGGEWKPWRRDVSGTVELPLSEILKDFSKWDSYVRKCDTDPEVKRELYSLARSGDEHALQVVRRRFVQDEDDSIDVILHAIKVLGQHFWLRFIDDFNIRDDVRKSCEHVYAEGISKVKRKDSGAVNWAEGLIRAAAITGNINSPEIDPLLDMLLLSEKPDYRHYDLAVMLLKEKKDIRLFADSIKHATDSMHEYDNRLPEMSEQLFRAGVYDMPKGLALQSSSEKSGEQYDDVKIGIKFLDQPTSQYPQCRIERLFTGRKVLEKFRDLSAKDDVSFSLWPSDCTPEKWPASWKFLMLSLLSQMDVKTELDGFIATLASRLTGSDLHKPDSEMFEALFKMLIEDENYTRIEKMIEIISSLPVGKSFDDLHKLRQNAEVNIAWKANNEGNTELARKLTDKLLAEGVKNSYIYFLDARLTWKDKNDPALCIEIAERHIESMTHGGSGRARMFNLIGCAYDELKRYPEALERFISASNEDHTQVFYFDNIAEIYDKMNEGEKAYEWAKEAKRRGSNTVIVDTILMKHKNMNN